MNRPLFNPLHDRLGPRFGRLGDALPILLAVALLVALGVVAARLTWSLLFFDATAVPVAAEPSPETRSAQPSAKALAEQLGKLAPFGTSNVAGQSADKPVHASTLAIRLVGVISGPDRPLAIVRVSGRTEVLQVGDKVTGNVRIHAIEPTRILLDHDGQLEFVELPRMTGDPLHGSLPAGAAFGTTGASGGAVPSKQVLLKQPEKLLNYVSFSTQRRNGTVTGYELTARAGQPDLLARLGLHSGDVITRVNGMPVKDPSAIGRVLPMLRSGKPVRAEVLRNGQPVQVTIDLDNVR